MQNFDEMIKQYATKVVDEDNPKVVKYVLKEAYRRRSINLQEIEIPPPPPPKKRNIKSKPISTPYGEFTSIKAAALANEVRVETLYKYIRDKKEGYEFL